MKETKLVKHSLQLAHSYKNIQSPPTSRWGFCFASPQPGAGSVAIMHKHPNRISEQERMKNRKQMKQDFWDVYAQGEMLDIFSGKEK